MDNAQDPKFVYGSSRKYNISVAKSRAKRKGKCMLNILPVWQL